MDTKTALMNCAETLARSRGFNSFSYADLAKEVGIRKPSIHHHFPAKSDLAVALISRYRKTFFARLDGIAAQCATGGARLRAWLDFYRQGLNGGKQICLCVAFSAGRENFDEKVLDQVNDFHRDSILWLTQVFQAGFDDHTITPLLNLDPKTEARACLATAEGAQLMARAAADTSLFDAAIAGLSARIKT